MIRRPTFPQLYEKNKILITKIGVLKATLDENKLFCDQTIRIAILWKHLRGVENNSINNSVKRYQDKPRKSLEQYSENIDYKYLLGILNSQIGNYLLNQIRGKGNIDINPEYLKNIPIPDIDSFSIQEKQIYDNIVSLVDQILITQKEYHAVKKEKDQEALKKKIDIIDNQIDKLVYELYGLTEEEIKIVNESK